MIHFPFQDASKRDEANLLLHKWLCVAAVQWLQEGKVCLRSSFSSSSYQTAYQIVKTRIVFSYLENIAAFRLFLCKKCTLSEFNVTIKFVIVIQLYVKIDAF